MQLSHMDRAQVLAEALPYIQPAGQRMGVDRFAQQRIFCLIHASAPFKK